MELIKIKYCIFLLTCLGWSSKYSVANDLIVQLELRTSKPDHIQLFYQNRTLSDSDNILFTESNSIKVKVEPSTEFKLVRIEVPEGAIENSFRIDFGNQAGNIWVINSILIINDSHSFNISTNEILKYFRFNEFITRIHYDFDRIEFSTIRGEKRCDPFIESYYSFSYYLEKRVKLIINSILILIVTLALGFINNKIFNSSIFFLDNFISVK